MNAAELLNEFRQRRSEQAFAELVRRFSGLVFSVARRRLNSDALAEEAAQSVFLRLAKSAPNLSSEPELIGWLHRTSVHVAVDLWRAETRRRAREEKAAAMQSTKSTNGPSPLALVVDEALDELSVTDRQALLLRFFDGQKMREIAGHLGISEDAAKMRVGRSLDRLRERLALRGIQTTAVLLAGFLTEQSASAIPAAITQSILRAVGPVVGAGSALLNLNRILNWKFASAVAGLSVAVIVFTSKLREDSSHGGQPSPAFKAAIATTNKATGSASALPDPPPAEATIAANPMKLLQDIVRARSRIVSGNIQYEQIIELNESSVHGAAETNTVLGQIIFDGTRRRIEQIGTEYHYTAVGDAGERQAQLMKDKKMHRAEAVREGLLAPFEAHHVSAFDGSVVMEYTENDGRSFQTAIRDINTGQVGQFDPRCLGLRAFGSTTLESGFSLVATNEAKLIGQEDVEGAPAWHIRVNCYGIDRDYWISTTHPERLLKHAENGDVIISRYAAPRDPLPVEVISQMRVLVQRFRRTATEYNIPVDPTTFTLAGLGMPPGTDVVDYRAHRSLGHWNGHGLSEGWRSKKEESETTNADAPTLLDQVAFLDSEPETPRGFDAALWVLFNTPDGPEVEKAAKTILDHHIQSTNLLALATRLETLRPRSAKQLLNEMLAKNPDAEIRATACFSLAQTFMEEAEYGANQKAVAEAKKYFQRFLRDFSATGKTARDRKLKSTKAIEEIDSAFVGHDAPVFTAATASGETLNTAENRGRVFLFLFRNSNAKYEAEEYRKVFDKVAGPNITFVSIFSGTDPKTGKIEDTVEASAPGWLIIRDGRAIEEAFHIHTWPSTVVIDKRGSIRNRNLRGNELEKAILAAAH